MPRPELVRLEAHQLAEAKQRQVMQDEEFRDMSSAQAVLAFLAEHDDFISQSQVSIGAHIHRRRIKALLELYTEKDWIEMESSGGQNQVRITKMGRTWLRLKAQEEIL